VLTSRALPSGISRAADRAPGRIGTRWPMSPPRRVTRQPMDFWHTRLMAYCSTPHVRWARTIEADSDERGW
jgi:hypothetical protein